MPSKKPSTIAEHIAAAPKEVQKNLHELLAILRQAAPRAKEILKRSMPVLEEKRILFAFAAFKSPVNFMPTPPAMASFAKELAAFKTGKCSIRFPHGERLPSSLICRIAAFRVKESREKDVRWM